MLGLKKYDFNTLKTKFQITKPWDTVVIFVLNILLAIPLFLIAHQNLIEPDWPWYLDRLLIALILIILIQLLLQA
ncbi:MAG: transglutaminase, partial [Flavobacterium sp.]